MKNINSNIPSKKLSRLGQRATFGTKMIELADKNKNLIVITADVAIPAGLDRYRKTFPNQYIDIGIAEQNMIGVAAGLASEGFDVFATTYAPFLTLRSLEQIRMNIGEMKHKVHLVGLSSGVVLGMIGNMHCSFEDIAVIRAIPNITIISPADSYELTKVLDASNSYNQSLYIRLTGGSPSPIIYHEDYSFEIGKGVSLRAGEDIAIISTGTIINESLKAADILMENGINTQVINMHTIRPIDQNLIKKVFQSKKLVVTLEEHSVIGGLGSAVAEASAGLLNKPPHLILGLPSDYSVSGIYEEMLEYYGLTANKIADKIINVFNDIR